MMVLKWRLSLQLQESEKGNMWLTGGRKRKQGLPENHVVEGFGLVGGHGGGGGGGMDDWWNCGQYWLVGWLDGVRTR